jgi:hypothetical protein
MGPTEDRGKQGETETEGEKEVWRIFHRCLIDAEGGRGSQGSA